MKLYTEFVDQGSKLSELKEQVSQLEKTTQATSLKLGEVNAVQELRKAAYERQEIRNKLQQISEG